MHLLTGTKDTETTLAIILLIALLIAAALVVFIFILLYKNREKREKIHELRNELNKFYQLEEIMKFREEFNKSEKNSNS